MLTREEAHKFYEALGTMIIEKGCKCLMGWQHIQSIVSEMTEKPKREIQIGDIYRDKHGGFREIDQFYAPGVPSQGFLTACGYHYSYAGKYIGDCEMPDLDISICYQLVEVEGE